MLGNGFFFFFTAFHKGGTLASEIFLVEGHLGLWKIAVFGFLYGVDRG